MQKYLKNNKGFTLVEVIVVAVIVLVLAAVAIPLYNGYVRDARINTANNIAGSIASGMGACIAARDLTSCGTAFDNGLTGRNINLSASNTTGQENKLTWPDTYTVKRGTTNTNSVVACFGTTTDFCSTEYVFAQ